VKKIIILISFSILISGCAGKLFKDQPHGFSWANDSEFGFVQNGCSLSRGVYRDLSGKYRQKPQVRIYGETVFGKPWASWVAFCRSVQANGTSECDISGGYNYQLELGCSSMEFSVTH